MMRAFANKYTLLIALLLFFSFALSQTLGDTLIENQAQASYSRSGSDFVAGSNAITTSVPARCSVELLPDGSLADLAHNVQALPGETVYLPYTLQNTGNKANDFEVFFTLESESSLNPESLSIILDSNNNGTKDSGEAVITALNIGHQDTVNVLLEVVLPGDYATQGSVYVDLTARCLGDASTLDSGNISLVTVPEGGAGLSKTASPGDGTSVLADEAISYQIDFTVSGRALSNVQLSDPLDANLAAPETLRVLINGVEQIGAATYDAISHTVSASFPSLSAGDEVELLIETSVLSEARGNQNIRNQASLSFDGGNLTSNTLSHPLPSICSLEIGPNGSIDAPAFAQTALPGETLVFPYVVRNTGNVANEFPLSLQPLEQSSITPEQAYLVHDLNGNGQVDEAEPRLTSLNLEAAEPATVLMVLQMPAGNNLSGDLFINLIGQCADTGSTDDDNIAQVILPLSGFSSPEKSSIPETGQALYPGASLRYEIGFASNGRELLDLVVIDELDEKLAAPSSFTTGLLTDPITDLTATVIGSYDAASHSLRWQIARVPAGMNVLLAVETSVRTDLALDVGSAINNTASVTSRDVAETPTNTVTHELRPIDVLLEKTASPEKVSIGETLSYTLSAINPEDGVPLETLMLSDTLPEGVSYIEGSSLLTFADGSSQEIEPSREGQTLVWDLSSLAAGERFIINFDVTVLPSALTLESIVNTANVVANDSAGRATANAAATVSTVVEPEIFRASSFLIGTVFVDVNDNGRYDSTDDLPTAGVRLYLSDGRSVITDGQGRYTFADLEPGLAVLRVDTTTLPARRLKETLAENAEGLFRVKLEPGLVSQQDIPLLAPGSQLDVDQVLNVSMGPVDLKKRILYFDDSNEDNTAVTVQLDIEVAEALKGLVIVDQLPEGAVLIQEPVALNSDSILEFKDLTMLIGDVPAGYQLSIRYQVREDAPKTLLLAPRIQWSLR